MGGHIATQKQDQFEQERTNELRTITKKYKSVGRRNVLLVGPPQSGKTQLFNSLVGKEYSEQYEIMESAQMGFKVFSTIESRYEQLYPISVHIVDAPGSFMRTEIAADYYFESPDVIFIVVDISLVLDDTKIDKTSQFVLRQVMSHHEYTRNAKRIPPLICHVFTKQDRVQPAVRKRNDKVIRNLARNGIIGNYLYVSTKSGQGMRELKRAIIDADIKGHGDNVKPPQPPKKKPLPAQIQESDPDPYDLLADQEMPEVIPGMWHHSKTEKPMKKGKNKKGKKNDQDEVQDQSYERNQMAAAIAIGDLSGQGSAQKGQY